MTPRHEHARTRFYAKTARAESGCLVWTSAIQSRGYGSFCFGGKGISVLAHRFAWELERGPIPNGLTIDHLCRNKRCQNVEHMEVVSLEENARRGNLDPATGQPRARCKRGHTLSGANLKVRTDGKRACRECERRLSLEAYHRKTRALRPLIQGELFATAPSGGAA